MIDLIPISRDVTYMGGSLSKVVKKTTMTYQDGMIMKGPDY